MRMILRFSIVWAILASSGALQSQSPQGTSSVATPTITASDEIEFNQAKRTFANFRTESVSEFMLIKAYHTRLLNEGKVTHKFQTIDGKLVHCIEIGSQQSIKNAGINPASVKFAPDVLPSTGAVSNTAANFILASFGMDGTFDTEGRVRRCPPGSIPVLIPSLEDLCRFGKFKDLFRKYPAEGGRALSAAVSQSTGRSPPPGSLYMEAPDAGVSHQYAHAYTVIDNQGEQAAFNVWQPAVERSNEFSLSQLWVVRPAADVPERQTVETGWQVCVNLYGDSQPHLFIYSTTHNYESAFQVATILVPACLFKRTQA